MKIMAPSIVQQTTTADVIVIGKVTAIEKEPSKALPRPGAAEKVDYTVAMITIAERLQGADGVTAIRVGFPTNRQSDTRPTPTIRPLPYRPVPVALTEGEEGCFFLTKHHEGDFYILAQNSKPLDKNAANFDTQIGTVKKIVKILDDPKRMLKSKDAGDRHFTASVLLQKYSHTPQVTTPGGKIVQEPIDAEQSKLILQALSEMEWGKSDSNGASLQSSFHQLGLQPKDGWAPPKFQQGQDFNKLMGEAVAKWLKENVDKHRILQRVVVND